MWRLRFLRHKSRGFRFKIYPEQSRVVYMMRKNGLFSFFGSGYFNSGGTFLSTGEILVPYQTLGTKTGDTVVLRFQSPWPASVYTSKERLEVTWVWSFQYQKRNKITLKDKIIFLLTSFLRLILSTFCFFLIDLLSPVYDPDRKKRTNIAKQKSILWIGDRMGTIVMVRFLEMGSSHQHP